MGKVPGPSQYHNVLTALEPHLVDATDRGMKLVDLSLRDYDETGNVDRLVSSARILSHLVQAHDAVAAMRLHV